MQLSFQRGRLVANQFQKKFEFGPNLEIIPKVSAAYEQAMVEDEKNRDHIGKGHKNLLKDVVYFLYTYNREKDAAYWFKYLREKYPEGIPANKTLDDYAVDRVQEEMGDTSRDRMEGMLEGMTASSFYNLAIDEDDRAVALDRLAKSAWTRFQTKIAGSQEQGFPAQMANQLRTKLNLPAPTNAPPAAVLKK
jgi:hypothetical protein